jgi:hypothetical protein
MKKTLLLIVATAVIATSATLAVLFLAGRGPVERLTSRTILDRVSEQAFLVTKTVIVDQKSSIEVDRGSAWSNFFWGQTIEAEALVRVDVGVDLASLTEDDIKVDHVRKLVTVDLPEATVLDASQFGDIEVDSTRGVLKFLLDNDPNEDHNQALDLLVRDARTSVEADRRLFDEAREAARGVLELVVSPFGYEVEIE